MMDASSSLLLANPSLNPFFPAAAPPPPLLRVFASSPGSPFFRSSLFPLKPSPKVAPICFSSSIRAADSAKKVVPYANYAVPLEDTPLSSCITRPLVEILRDLNKRVPDKVLKTKLDEGMSLKYIPWYHANRMLSFYAPGWCGEVRNVTYSADGKVVTVVYRVTIRGSDGEVYRESSGTVSMDDNQFEDPVQKAEAMAFRRACARFGLGLYLYHEDGTE